mmetsp:Transcript_118049/g.338638  ORF Transcript_118049/g.338638 Transcript_118049/m.338638 type:complete len:259 (-) Transcript_118049:413-1189(-)
MSNTSRLGSSRRRMLNSARMSLKAFVTSSWRLVFGTFSPLAACKQAKKRCTKMSVHHSAHVGAKVSSCIISLSTSMARRMVVGSSVESRMATTASNKCRFTRSGSGSLRNNDKHSSMYNRRSVGLLTSLVGRSATNLAKGSSFGMDAATERLCFLTPSSSHFQSRAALSNVSSLTKSLMIASTIAAAACTSSGSISGGLSTGAVLPKCSWAFRGAVTKLAATLSGLQISMSLAAMSSQNCMLTASPLTWSPRSLPNSA